MTKLIPSSKIPEGVCGNWRVERFEIPEKSLAFTYGHRAPKPGIYTRIMQGRTLWMSDTDAEKWDHYEAVRMAHGKCLVHGLGLGMVAEAMALKDDVESVTVIEISHECISLVAPHLHPKVRVIHADALTWQPPKGARYDVAWHDIWANICLDDVAERSKLMRRYGRRSKWQGCWAQDEIRRARKS